MQKCDYRLYLTKTIDLKELLFEKKRRHGISWWYPKNAMVFVPGPTIAGDPGFDAAVAALDTETLTWRIRSKNPTFNLVTERDRYAYLHIVGAGINAAARRLRGSARRGAE